MKRIAAAFLATALGVLPVLASPSGPTSATVTGKKPTVIASAKKRAHRHVRRHARRSLSPKAHAKPAAPATK